MNLLLVNKYFWRKGGSEAVFFGEMALLKKYGHQIIPFSMQDELNEPTDYSKYFVSNIDFNCAGLIEKITAAGRIIYSFEARRKIDTLLHENSVDIAHFHLFQHQISPSVFGPLRKSGIPIILTLHDLKPICPSYLMYRNGHICEECKNLRFYNCVKYRCTKDSRLKSMINMVEMYLHYLFRFYKDVDLYIAVSDFYRQKMIEFGFEAEKILHIPNFVDTKIFQYANRDNGYALYFGRLSDEKGLTTLIDACAITTDIPVIIAGSGPADMKLKKRVSEMGLKHISFVGYKSGTDLIDLLEAASFTILPSLCYENCPMSVLESLAVGTPVICSLTGGAPELIDNGLDGLTFEVGSSEDLASKMRILWDDIKLRKVMGIHGSKKVSTVYNPDTHYQKLVSTYRSLK